MLGFPGILFALMFSYVLGAIVAIPLLISGKKKVFWLTPLELKKPDNNSESKNTKNV